MDLDLDLDLCLDQDLDLDLGGDLKLDNFQPICESIINIIKMYPLKIGLNITISIFVP